MSTLIARHVAAQVAQETGIDAKLILSDCMLRSTCRARNMVYFRLRQRGWSFRQIGMSMDRHYSSVLHGVRMAIHQARKGDSHAPS